MMLMLMQMLMLYTRSNTLRTPQCGVSHRPPDGHFCLSVSHHFPIYVEFSNHPRTMSNPTYHTSLERGWHQWWQWQRPIQREIQRQRYNALKNQHMQYFQIAVQGYNIGYELNIARGTTDPGYWVFNLNYLVDHIKFVCILDNSSFRLNCLGPLWYHLNWLQIWPPDDATCIDYKFSHLHQLKFWPLGCATCISWKWGHQVAPLAFTQNTVIRWCQLHWFHQIATLADEYKYGHQVVSLALSHCLGMAYWHYQLLSSWYLHQPESHQFRQHKSLTHSVSDTRTHRSDPRYTWVR